MASLGHDEVIQVCIMYVPVPLFWQERQPVVCFTSQLVLCIGLYTLMASVVSRQIMKQSSAMHGGPHGHNYTVCSNDSANVNTDHLNSFIHLFHRVADRQAFLSNNSKKSYVQMMIQNTPSVIQNTPPMIQNTTSMIQNTPSMNQNTPSILQIVLWQRDKRMYGSEKIAVTVGRVKYRMLNWFISLYWYVSLCRLISHNFIRCRPVNAASGGVVDVLILEDQKVFHPVIEIRILECKGEIIFFFKNLRHQQNSWHYTIGIFPPAIDIIPTLLVVVYSNGKYTN